MARGPKRAPVLVSFEDVRGFYWKIDQVKVEPLAVCMIES